MNVSATDARQYAPGSRIEVNGVVLDPELAHSLLSVKVEQELNKTNGFVLEVQDLFNGGQFKWLQREVFHLGNPVVISLGYTDSLTKIVEGKIKNLNGSFHAGCAPTFTVEGADQSYDFLTVSSDTKTYRQKRDSDIAEEIARQAGLTPDVQPTSRVNAVKTKKGGTSYIQFLDFLAGENNYEFLLRGNRLRFKESAYDDSGVSVGWGRQVIRFEPNLNTSSAVTEVIVRAWDSTRKTQIEGRARAGEEKKQEQEKTTSSQVARSVFGEVVRVITDRPVRSVSEAQGIARSELNRAGNHFVDATLEIPGTPELVPGTCLEVEGFGTLFSGKYYIVKATHKLDRDGYRTSLSVRRNAI